MAQKQPTRATLPRGYRGESTGNRYIEPGEVTVGTNLDIPNRVITRALLDKLVGWGMAEVIETADEAPEQGGNPEPEQKPKTTRGKRKTTTSKPAANKAAE